MLDPTSSQRKIASLEEENSKMRLTIERLRGALCSVITAWTEPGPMGTFYEMPRAVSYAKSVHDDTHP